MRTVSMFASYEAKYKKLNTDQLIALLPFDDEDKLVYDSARQMYADHYGEQAYEMRANDMNPGTFNQWLRRQLARRDYYAS